MFARIRSIWLAGGGALALTIVLSGVVAAGTVLTALVVTSDSPTAPAVDTSKTFEDVDGNGVDDDCQTDVVADPVAAASAQAAVDANGDGTISVTEAAHSDRTGGTNCNHGGYVSSVAKAQCATTQPAGTTDTSTSSDEPSEATTDEASQGDEDAAESQDAVENQDATDCTADETAAPAQADAPTCEVAPATEPTDEPATVEPTAPEDLAPNAHGKAVAAVAHSDAVGGKNCNHGGAVSQAAHDANQAARDARAAAKAARDAARAEAKANREAARAGKQHGKHH